MSATEWIILIAVLGSLLGGLFTLRNRARSLHVSREQMDRIRERKKGLEEQEKREAEKKEQ